MKRLFQNTTLLLMAASPAVLLLLLPWPSGIDNFNTFLGRFHPVVLHLPIGMIVFVGLLETVHVLSFGRLKHPSKLPLFLGAFTATLAMALGILLMRGESMQGALIESHLYWGIGTAVITWIALAMRLPQAFATKRWLRGAYRLMVFGTCGVLTIASHQGASVTHGETYLTDHLPEPIAAPIAEHLPWLLHQEDAETAQAAAERFSLPVEQRVVYTDLIDPIFAAKCYACHQTTKFKGGLMMDSHAALLAGGVSGPAIEPGDSEFSITMERIYLPLDDEERMPPANQEQLTDDEIKLIAWWIDTGASETATVTELTPDEAIFDMIQGVSAELADAAVLISEETSDEEAKLASAEAVAAQRSAIASALKSAQQAFPGSLNYVAGNSAELVAKQLTQPLTDADITALQPVAPQLVQLHAPGAALTAEGITALSNMTNLTRLDLSASGLNDETLAALNNPTLVKLNLFGTPITDASVPVLSKHQNLERLYLANTKITAEGQKALAAALPGCQIFSAPITLATGSTP